MLRDALRKTRKVGLGQIVVRGQGSIVAIRPYGKGLLMETLRYADEVQKAGRILRRHSRTRSPTRSWSSLAEELIERKTKQFDPKEFKDTYTVALRELIEAKIEKRPPRAIEEPQPAPTSST